MVIQSCLLVRTTEFMLQFNRLQELSVYNKKTQKPTQVYKRYEKLQEANKMGRCRRYTTSALGLWKQKISKHSETYMKSKALIKRTKKVAKC